MAASAAVPAEPWACCSSCWWPSPCPSGAGPSEQGFARKHLAALDADLGRGARDRTTPLDLDGPSYSNRFAHARLHLRLRWASGVPGGGLRVRSPPYRAVLYFPLERRKGSCDHASTLYRDMRTSRNGVVAGERRDGGYLGGGGMGGATRRKRAGLGHDRTPQLLEDIQRRRFASVLFGASCRRTPENAHHTNFSERRWAKVARNVFRAL
jgi:hypothetical protein